VARARVRAAFGTPADARRAARGIWQSERLPARGATCTLRICRHLKENRAMTGIQFVTDEKGRKVVF
jgi:hypothetical protein